MEFVQTLAQDHWKSLALGVLAMLTTFAFAEAFKAPLKLWGAWKYGERWTDPIKDTAVMLLLLVGGLVAAAAWDFQLHVLKVFDFWMAGVWAVLVGGLLNFILAIGFHVLLQKIPVVRILRARLQKTAGVTQADLDALKTKSMAVLIHKPPDNEE